MPCLKETKWREQEVRGVCNVVDRDLKGILEKKKKNNGLMMIKILLDKKFLVLLVLMHLRVITC